MVKFIADIGSNHNNDIKRINKFAKVAKEIGFWGIKYQVFDPEMLYANKQPDDLKKNALNKDLIPQIIKSAQSNGLKIGITPFYKDEELLQYKFDFIKISSFDILRDKFIDSVLEKNKLTFISLGMAMITEIDELIKKMKNKTVVLMHCISQYPTDPKIANIHKIKYLKTKYNLENIGYSDHSVSEGVIFAAMVNGARFFELHFDLDDLAGNESKFGHCWTYTKSKSMLNNIVDYEDSLRDSFVLIDKYLYADPNDGMRPIKELR